MQLSEAALKHDSSQPCLPVKDCFIDPQWNCRRQQISMTDVSSLMRDIASKGLLQPIIVRKADDGRYQVIAGHRRYTAYKYLRAEKIPAIIKDVTEFEAKSINATENLQRKDLNVMQEAWAIEHFRLHHWGRETIAKEINVSPGWVQLRLMWLDMPKEVQEIANTGWLRPDDVRELSKLSGDEQIRAAARLRDLRRGGDTKVKLTRPEKATTMKARRPPEILEMMDLVRETLTFVDPDINIKAGDLISQEGNFFLTSLAAWSAGFISNHEFHKRFRNFCKLVNIEYTIPAFEQIEKVSIR